MMRLKLFIIAVTLFILGSCQDQGPVIDQEYHAELYFINMKTKKPYFTELDKDSLRIYQEENNIAVPIYSGGYVDRSRNNGYVINAIRLVGLEKLVLYVYFNQYDTDTLMFNNQITYSKRKNTLDHYLTTILYNGKYLKRVSSDTSSTVFLEIFK